MLAYSLDGRRQQPHTYSDSLGRRVNASASYLNNYFAERRYAGTSVCVHCGEAGAHPRVPQLHRLLRVFAAGSDERLLRVPVNTLHVGAVACKQAAAGEGRPYPHPTPPHPTPPHPTPPHTTLPKTHSPVLQQNYVRQQFEIAIPVPSLKANYK